ncbi:MAG TPA: glycosyltransferase family 4 protein [Candidatus Limnocylindrales bacterium]|nr:glycosyltransferase family 4 protein [Candidatus Limnocylindrales bacterium]
MPRSILVLNERDLRNPLAGGAEVHLFETFGRLARAGHEVTVLVASFPGCRREEIIDGVRVVRLTNRYFYYLAVPIIARRMIARGRYEVVIDVLCKLPFLSPWLLPRPCVAIVHHLFGTTAFQQVAFPIATVTYLSEKLIPRAYRDCWSIAVSPSTRDDLVVRGLDRSRILVIPNGVDCDLYHPDPRHRSPTPLIVWLGRAEPYKRVDLLLQALAQLRPLVPGVRLAIVGDGTASADLQQMAERLGVADIVDFLGFVDSGLKVAMLQKAHVLANTSEKEGWGLTVLEGAACGTPTVASNVPGLRDSVRDGDTGLLVPHGDIVALTSALVSVLTDDDLRERMARRARQWAIQFTWDRSAHDVERIIEAVAADAPVTGIASPFADG